MPVTYTNRKGREYYLHQGVTKTGKTRYYFSRKQHGDLVDEIPKGYEISESVNGIVSLIKKRPWKILPAEVKVVETAIQQHEKPNDYRMSIRHNQIEIYERVGRSPAEIFAALDPEIFDPEIERRLQEEERIYSQFTAIVRFILRDEKERIFRVKRMCYLGSVEDWIDIGRVGKLGELVAEIIPLLGTEEYFELY